MTKKQILIAIGALALFAGYYFFNQNYTFETTSASSLESSSEVFSGMSANLGNIPMSEGIRTLSFEYTNSLSEPLSLTQMYTTCMCTKAKLVTSDTTTVFAGMKGHKSGLMPINPGITLQPGETTLIEVEFDPNAHGPDAVGPITRSVVIETNSPSMPQLEFMFSGVVTK